MPVKDKVVTWWIQNVILPKKEIIDKPGFIINTLSGNSQSIYLREFFLSEQLFELIETKIVQRYGDQGRQVLYSAGKKFGYLYASMSNFPTIKNNTKKKFIDFAYFLVRYIETLFAMDVEHEVDIENKIFTISAKDYIICRHNGLGHIMTEGGIAGIWAYVVQDQTVEGIQNECQGRGDQRCRIICAPEEILKNKISNFYHEKSLHDQKFNNIYKTLNEIRKSTYSSNSLNDLINAGFFKYRGGVLSYNNMRFFAFDSHLLYLLDEEIVKLDGGEQILFDACFEFGKLLRETYGGTNYQKFIPDFFSALGFGDILVINSNKLRIASFFYPWTIFSKQSKYIIFRGIMSGFVSGSLGRNVQFNNVNVEIRNNLTLTISV
ncbi:MAG: hypothetical protein NT038_00185 [Euryarchaeota archaeon]|nr:hypothetical protein [Euryarchaeota archaeon]